VRGRIEPTGQLATHAVPPSRTRSLCWDLARDTRTKTVWLESLRLTPPAAAGPVGPFAESTPPGPARRAADLPEFGLDPRRVDGATTRTAFRERPRDSALRPPPPDPPPTHHVCEVLAAGSSSPSLLSSGREVRPSRGPLSPPGRRGPSSPVATPPWLTDRGALAFATANLPAHVLPRCWSAARDPIPSRLCLWDASVFDPSPPSLSQFVTTTFRLPISVDRYSRRASPTDPRQADAGGRCEIAQSEEVCPLLEADGQQARMRAGQAPQAKAAAALERRDESSPASDEPAKVCSSRRGRLAPAAAPPPVAALGRVLERPTWEEAERAHAVISSVGQWVRRRDDQVSGEAADGVRRPSVARTTAPPVSDRASRSRPHSVPSRSLSLSSVPFGARLRPVEGRGTAGGGTPKASTAGHQALNARCYSPPQEAILRPPRHNQVRRATLLCLPLETSSKTGVTVNAARSTKMTCQRDVHRPPALPPASPRAYLLSSLCPLARLRLQLAESRGNM
ncbi:hypothetical protein THAOC_35427, partial [Thalassiosira oceanica]